MGPSTLEFLRDALDTHNLQLVRDLARREHHPIAFANRLAGKRQPITGFHRMRQQQREPPALALLDVALDGRKERGGSEAAADHQIHELAVSCVEPGCAGASDIHVGCEGRLLLRQRDDALHPHGAGGGRDENVHAHLRR